MKFKNKNMPRQKKTAYFLTYDFTLGGGLHIEAVEGEFTANMGYFESCMATGHRRQIPIGEISFDPRELVRKEIDSLNREHDVIATKRARVECAWEAWTAQVERAWEAQQVADTKEPANGQRK